MHSKSEIDGELARIECPLYNTLEISFWLQYARFRSDMTASLAITAQNSCFHLAITKTIPNVRHITEK